MSGPDDGDGIFGKALVLLWWAGLLCWSQEAWVPTQLHQNNSVMLQ